MNSDPKEWATRYPFTDFDDDFSALQEELIKNPQTNLRQWVRIWFGLKHADKANAAERGQILLNAQSYYERNLADFDQEGGLVLGEDRSLLTAAFVGALYALVMQSPSENPNIQFPVSEFLLLVKRHKDAGW